MDMTVLPEGELEAVPFMSYDFLEFFPEFKDCSYTTKNGTPIMLLVLKQSDIRDYPTNSKNIYAMFLKKRNSCSDFSLHFCKNPKQPESLEIIKRMGITESTRREYILGYLMHISGAANVKIMDYERIHIHMDEEIKKKKRGKKLLSDSILDNLVILAEIYVQGHNRYIRVNDVFKELKHHFHYECIMWGIRHASNSLEYFFLLEKNNTELIQTNYLTDFLDRNPEIEDIIDKAVSAMPEPEDDGELFELN